MTTQGPDITPTAALPMVTVLGLGRMGAAIRGRLTEQQFEVTGWSRSAAATGAGRAVEAADVVLTCLRDDQAVLDVMSDIASALRPGALVLDLSSIHPRTVASVRALLPASVRLVDVPVMGSNDLARNGQLGLLAGGTVDDITAARTVLDRLGSVRHVGDLGSGMALKATLMSGVIPAVTLVRDVLTVGRSLGLTTEQICAGLTASPLGPIAGRAFSTTADYPVSLAAKDLALISSTPGLQLVHAAAHALATAGDLDEDLGAWATRRP